MAEPWQVSDLRALDPLDASDPSQDLIAVYTRSIGLEDNIRLDFLDVPETPASDIYIALDTKPGGSNSAHLSRLDLEGLYPEGLVNTDIAYDSLIVIPAEGEPGVLDLSTGFLSTSIRPTIIRDPVLDTLTVIFNRFELPAEYSLQVFVTPAGEHSPADQTDAISSNDNPAGRTNLLMAFSNTFPATTPAQTLRRWDGAHTGPYGERHGLNPLLEAAATYGIPLTLLDLKTPSSLSALDLTGGLEKVQKMWRNRLLILPDAAYGEPVDVSVAHGVQAAESFGLPVGKFYYGNDSVSTDYELEFFKAPQKDPRVSIVEWQGQKMIGIPSAVEEQTTPDGLTLDTRRLLIESALNGDMLILGGNLPDSTWGDSDAGPAGLRYIAAHPWIRTLTGDDLQKMPAEIAQVDPRPEYSFQQETAAIYNSSGQLTGLDSETLRKEILARLENAPDNPLTDSAWEMYFMLTALVDDPKLGALNAQYLGDINILLTAADWAHSPAHQSTCSVDLNFDLLPDCVIADQNYFAVFQSDGGRLSYLFSYDGRNVHQIVGPGWQFTTGLSDRTEWNPSVGPAADSLQIPGAFYDLDSPWRMYSPELAEDGSIIFTSQEGKTKIYHVGDKGIQLDYKGEPLTASVGLSLDPWKRIDQGWGRRYHSSANLDWLQWRLENGPSVQLSGQHGIIAAFNDTLQYLGELEDPNQNFPTGHYLPFPMAVMEIQLENGVSTSLVIK